MSEHATITTNRLILRPFTMDDAPSVQQLASDEAVTSTSRSVPYPCEDGMAEQWIEHNHIQDETGKQLTFAIERSHDAVLLGSIRLTKISMRSYHAELGCWIGSPYWGQGYCTEASHAVLEYAFDTMGMHRIYAFHLTRNPASGRVMHKLGMTYEGCLREHTKRWGEYEDLAAYGILKHEYRHVI